MGWIHKIKFVFRKRELKRLGLKRVVTDNEAWIEGPDGWKVRRGNDHPADPIILYYEGSRLIVFDAAYWHESVEDRKADKSEMSIRQLMRYYDRQVFRIYVDDDLQWNDGSKEFVTPDIRERILNNIEIAIEFESGQKPHFVKLPQ